MNRRQFVGHGSLVAGALAVRGSRAVGRAQSATRADAPQFTTDDAGLQKIYDAALATLQGNGVQIPVVSGAGAGGGQRVPRRVAGVRAAGRRGVRDGRAGGRGQLARNNHLIFFALQKEDGQLPCSVKDGGPAFGQIQMVVPIAATAWELSQRTGDQELLEKAYAACGRWDAWLRQYRDTRGTGLCEGFCTYDTGQDNSPRWKGLASRCPEGDARKCPAGEGLPRLCPDLSATVYGGRVALAAMAKALGKKDDADRWNEDAETIRELIIEKLYDPVDGGVLRSRRATTSL